MSKRFKGKPCVYCLHPSSDDGDHVICRQFFLPQHRENLPKVPSCRGCNKKKSDLEHYLTAVLPFGGRHAAAGMILKTMVPPRLGKNVKLHASLAAGRKTVFSSRNGGPWAPQMSVPFDSQHLSTLFEYIAKGLAWHHWQTYIGPDCFVKAGFFVGAGQRAFEQLLSMNGTRIKANLGHGTFEYEGVQACECPELTVWRMSFYGVELEGDRKNQFARCSDGYVISAPKKMPSISKFAQLMWAIEIPQL